MSLLTRGRWLVTTLARRLIEGDIKNSLLSKRISVLYFTPSTHPPFPPFVRPSLCSSSHWLVCWHRTRVFTVEGVIHSWPKPVVLRVCWDGREVGGFQGEGGGPIWDFFSFLFKLCLSYLNSKKERHIWSCASLTLVDSQHGPSAAATSWQPAWSTLGPLKCSTRGPLNFKAHPFHMSHWTSLLSHCALYWSFHMPLLMCSSLIFFYFKHLDFWFILLHYIFRNLIECILIVSKFTNKAFILTHFAKWSK